jgi:uncharacterized integral membrane protein
MLKLIRVLLALVGAVLIIVLSVDNRQDVPVVFWPLPFSLEVPLYWVLLFGLCLGAIMGGLAMWLSHVSARRETRALRRKVRAVDYQEKLARERKEQEILEQGRRKTQAIAIAGPRNAA